MDSDYVGRSLLILGALIALLVAGILFFSRISFLGGLPGDISFQRDGFSILFPVLTCLVLSLILTVAVNIAIRRSFGSVSQRPRGPSRPETQRRSISP